jgi:hypothetical protein
MLGFFLGWLTEYPEYNTTDFYITGESFAGKKRLLRGTLIEVGLDLSSIHLIEVFDGNIKLLNLQY